MNIKLAKICQIFISSVIFHRLGEGAELQQGSVEAVQDKGGSPDMSELTDSSNNHQNRSNLTPQQFPSEKICGGIGTLSLPDGRPCFCMNFLSSSFVGSEISICSNGIFLLSKMEMTKSCFRFIYSQKSNAIKQTKAERRK